jgi:hypothetical protein
VSRESRPIIKFTETFSSTRTTLIPADASTEFPAAFEHRHDGRLARSINPLASSIATPLGRIRLAGRMMMARRAF